MEQNKLAHTISAKNNTNMDWINDYCRYHDGADFMLSLQFTMPYTKQSRKGFKVIFTIIPNKVVLCLVTIYN